MANDIYFKGHKAACRLNNRLPVVFVAAFISSLVRSNPKHKAKLFVCCNLDFCLDKR